MFHVKQKNSNTEGKVREMKNKDYGKQYQRAFDLVCEIEKADNIFEGAKDQMKELAEITGYEHEWRTCDEGYAYDLFQAMTDAVEARRSVNPDWSECEIKAARKLREAGIGADEIEAIMHACGLYPHRTTNNDCLDMLEIALHAILIG